MTVPPWLVLSPNTISGWPKYTPERIILLPRGMQAYHAKMLLCRYFHMELCGGSCVSSH